MKLFNRINFQYTVSTQTPDLTQKTGFTDTTNPLSVIRGNTSLKTSSNHHLEFLAETGGVCPYAHLKIETNIIDNMVANSFSYNPLTGIYTYRLLNVKGNWNTKISTLYRTYIDHGKYFRAEGRTSFNYVHNVDLATIEGFSTSQLSRVNHYITSQSAKVSYNKESLRLDAIGDFAWNVARRELDNVSEISAFDFSYGISGQYTLPWKIQLATDLKMYSRRGYEEPSMNTDELVWNASVSRPFLKGKLVVRIDGFDILNHLSSTRYIVNGQGRTETWQLCMSRYAMLRVAYKFNKNPKNK
ncbi:MAG: outer membrane beta-barrel protein [Prevotellaceae bacterium]|nr:outer membrane beta-barrel protein [Prevotellaceae bacterium]